MPGLLPRSASEIAAFLLGTHPRLGSASPVFLLPPPAVRRIGSFLAVRKADTLSRWRSATLRWEEVPVPQRAPWYGVSAVPFGQRLVVTVASPRAASGELPLTRPDEFWLVGPGGFVERIPLPLPADARLRCHETLPGGVVAAVLDDADADGLCTFARFRLGADGFAPEGPPRRVDGSAWSGALAKQFAPEPKEVPSFRVKAFWWWHSRLETDGLAILEHGKLVAEVEVQVHCMHVSMGPGSCDAELLLCAGKNAGLDAFYETMRLIDWHTGTEVRTVPLDFGPRYIECKWDRGMLPGTQTFYTVYSGKDDNDAGHGESVVVAFCTPED